MITTLDLMMQLFPDKSLPYDYNMVNVAEMYQLLNQDEKALEIIKALFPKTMEELEYYFRMSRKSLFTGSMFQQDQLRAETCIAYAINISKKAGDTAFADKLQADYDALRLQYGIPSMNERRAK